MPSSATVRTRGSTCRFTKRRSRWIGCCARGERDRARITIVSPEKLGGLLGGDAIAPTLQETIDERGIEFAPGFSVNRATEKEVWAGDDQRMEYDLLMLEWFTPFGLKVRRLCSSTAWDRG